MATQTRPWLYPAKRQPWEGWRKLIEGQTREVTLKLWHLVIATLVQVIWAACMVGVIYGHFSSAQAELERRVTNIETRQEQSTTENSTWRGQVMETLGKIEGEILETNREARTDRAERN